MHRFHQDGNLLAFVSDGNIVNLWDVGSRETIVTLEGHRGGVPIYIIFTRWDAARLRIIEFIG